MAFKVKKGALLSKQEQWDEHLLTMARVYARADSTLARQRVATNVTDTGGAPAWSDGETITFNAAMIGDVRSVDDIIALSGLNYHELSHILYTPRNNHHLVMQVQSENLWMYFNALEDQRIETLMAARFPATRPYFVSTVMKYIAKDKGAWTEAFPLLHGRRYLPANIRGAFRARYKDQALVQEIADVIDEYRFLNPDLNTARMHHLVREFKRLLVLANQQNMPDPFAHEGRPQQGITQGSKEGARSTSETIEDAKDDEASGDDDGGEGGGDDGGDTEDGAGQGSGKDKKGDQGGQGEKGEDAPGSGAGQSGTGDHDMDDTDLAEAMDDATSKAQADPQVQNDVKEKQRIIAKGDGKTLPKVSRAGASMANVSPSAVLSAKRFGQELSRLQHELDPGLKTHQSSGRINIKRAMHGHDVDELFDQWEEGKQDSTDIELVILVDYSSSMSRVMSLVSEVLWVIKRGAESASGQVVTTVVGFDTQATILYERGHRAEAGRYRRFSSAGGTEPSEALREARRIFANSRKARKVLLVVTDGDWAEPGGVYTQSTTTDVPSNDDALRIIEQAGVLTGFVYIDTNHWGNAGSWATHRGCQVSATVEQPNDLIPFAKALVKRAMRK